MILELKIKKRINKSILITNKIRFKKPYLKILKNNHKY